MYRVGSRLAQNTAYSTVRSALLTMASKKRTDLQRHFTDTNQKPLMVVFDNIQAYARRRDHRIGTKNQMILGTGGTAVEMEDCAHNAFDLEPILERLERGVRRKLTPEDILRDIDTAHFDTVFKFHWLVVLVMFVPSCDIYRTEVSNLFAERTRKHQINPNRHTIVHPLGTNSENEVSLRGMLAALRDFLSQLGITSTRGRLMFFSGDGKSFELMHQVRRYLSGTKSDLLSLRFIRPVLELWHTKWTDLSRICRSHWGGKHTTTDPSTLGFMARAINSPTPSDFQKVEFYPNARLVKTVVHGHMLECWE